MTHHIAFFSIDESSLKVSHKCNFQHHTLEIKLFKAQDINWHTCYPTHQFINEDSISNHP